MQYPSCSFSVSVKWHQNVNVKAISSWNQCSTQTAGNWKQDTWRPSGDLSVTVWWNTEGPGVCLPFSSFSSLDTEIQLSVPLFSTLREPQLELRLVRTITGKPSTPTCKLLFSGVADPFRKNVHFFISQFQFFQRAISNSKFWGINHPSPQLDWTLYLAAPGVIKLLSHLRPRAPYRSNIFVKFSVSLSLA